MNKSIRYSFLITGSLLSGIVMAATETSTLDVTASVAASCSVTASPMSFGTISSDASTDLNSTTDLFINCTSGSAYNVSLDAGLYFSSPLRRVKNTGTDYIVYKLYSDAGHTTEWGDSDFAGTYTAAPSVSNSGSGSNQTLTVYGVMSPGNAGSTLVAGTSYSDTINVTLNF